MSDVVFILGAGASVASGGPTMATFLDRAKDLLLSGHVPTDSREQFETVFAVIGALQVVHSKAHLDLKNIESIFTVIELGKIIASVPGLKDVSEIENAISSLKRLIVITLESEILFDRHGSNIRNFNSHRSYVEFAQLLSDITQFRKIKRTASVITFNYDLALDVAMQRAQLGPDYIIEECPGLDRSQQVELMKLHGSLNWAIEEESLLIRPLHIVDYIDKAMPYEEVHGNKVKLTVGSHISSYFKRFFPDTKVASEPVIVPPSWNKSDYHKTLSNVWKSAAKNLSEAEYIFICGYSLPETDSFFRHLFALGSVGNKPLRRIDVFDPDETEDVKRRFQSMLGPGAKERFEFHVDKFEAAIGSIRRIMGGLTDR